MRQAERVQGILLGGPWIRGRRFALGALHSADRHRPGLGHSPEFDNCLRRDLHLHQCGGGEADTEQALPRAPWGAAEASLTPVARSLPQLEHCSPTAYEGYRGPGGWSPGCRRPWSPAS